MSSFKINALSQFIFLNIALESQAVKNVIWLFEQEQALGFSSVSTNIRMTVIKLKSGGLWIHAPIAPTKECIEVFILVMLTCQVVLFIHFIKSHILIQEKKIKIKT